MKVYVLFIDYEGDRLLSRTVEIAGFYASEEEANLAKADLEKKTFYSKKIKTPLYFIKSFFLGELTEFMKTIIANTDRFRKMNPEMSL